MKNSGKIKVAALVILVLALMASCATWQQAAQKSTGVDVQGNKQEAGK